MLVHAERRVLTAVGWDLMAAVREAGLGNWPEPEAEAEELLPAECMACMPGTACLGGGEDFEDFTWSALWPAQ